MSLNVNFGKKVISQLNEHNYGDLAKLWCYGSHASEMTMQYGPKTVEYDLAGNKQTVWDYESENFDSRVWNVLYKKWSLIV